MQSAGETSTAIGLLLGYVTSALFIIAAAIFYLAATLSEESGMIIPLSNAALFYLLGMGGLLNAFRESKKVLSR